MAFYSGSKSLQFRHVFDRLAAGLYFVFVIGMLTFSFSQKIAYVRTFEEPRKHCLYYIILPKSGCEGDYDLKGISKLSLPQSRSFNKS